MVTLTGQNVPPLLQALYSQYISKGQTQPGGMIYTAAKPTATVAVKPKRKKNTVTDWERIVEFIAGAWGRDADNPTDREWRAARRIEIQAGTFPEPYWQEMPVIARVRLRVEATSEEQTPRPPYDYPKTTNRPTLTTWGAPATTDEPIGYHGELQDELFSDLSWTYEVAEFQIAPRIPGHKETSAIALMAGTIYAVSNSRGSRAMFSILSRLEQLNAPSATLDDAPPPLKPATSHYWPFDAPRTDPPYYAAQEARILYRLATRTNATSKGRIVRLTYSVRPMMGHENNNNDTVTTEFDATARVFSVPAAIRSRHHITIAKADDWNHGLFEITPLRPIAVRWRSTAGIAQALIKVPQGWVDRSANNTYHLRSDALTPVLDFEQQPGFETTELWPGPAAIGYQTFKRDNTHTPNRYYKFTWDEEGAALTPQYRTTPWPDRWPDGNAQAASPTGHTVVWEGDAIVIRDALWRLVATVDIDTSTLQQEDLHSYGDAVAWVAYLNENDEDDLYCITLPPPVTEEPATPPVITPTLVTTATLDSANCVTLGDDIYIQQDATTFHAFTPAGIALPFAGVPTGYFISLLQRYRTDE
jgi:hypothetical protein